MQPTGNARALALIFSTGCDIRILQDAGDLGLAAAVYAPEEGLADSCVEWSNSC
jgi:hypothetical protein